MSVQCMNSSHTFLAAVVGLGGVISSSAAASKPIHSPLWEMQRQAHCSPMSFLTLDLTPVPVSCLDVPSWHITAITLLCHRSAARDWDRVWERCLISAP